MFPKSFKTKSYCVLLIVWGCLLLTPMTTLSAPAQVNLNTATAEQLESLPGIGPDLAQRILDYRADSGPFKNVDELLNVKGIGEGKLSKLRDQVTLGVSSSAGKDHTREGN